MGGGGGDPYGGFQYPYPPHYQQQQQQYANMQQQAQNAFAGLGNLGMQNANICEGMMSYKPKKKTQAMKRYEKLIAKRDRMRLCVSLGVSLFLVLMSVSWFFGFNGLLLSGSALGVITAITTLVWWMDR